MKNSRFEKLHNQATILSSRTRANCLHFLKNQGRRAKISQNEFNFSADYEEWLSHWEDPCDAITFASNYWFGPGCGFDPYLNRLVD